MAGWVSEYDYPNRTVSLTLASGRPTIDTHWDEIVLDERLSDPDGNFLVFSSVDPDGGREPVPVKVVLRLNEAGGLLRPHRDFDEYVIGSPTIWPAELHGPVEADASPYRRLAEHWVWWIDDGSISKVGQPADWPGAPAEGA